MSDQMMVGLVGFLVLAWTLFKPVLAFFHWRDEQRTKREGERRRQAMQELQAFRPSPADHASEPLPQQGMEISELEQDTIINTPHDYDVMVSRGSHISRNQGEAEEDLADVEWIKQETKRIDELLKDQGVFERLFPRAIELSFEDPPSSTEVEKTSKEDQFEGIITSKDNETNQRTEASIQLCIDQRETIKRLLNPWHLRIEGDYKETIRDEDGNTIGYRIRRSNTVETNIESIAKIYGCSWWTVLNLVQLRASLGVTEGRITSRPESEFELTEIEFAILCEHILMSQIIHGHPLGPVGNDHVFVGGISCFPAGVLPRAMARDIVGGYVTENMVPSDLVKSIHRTWIEHTQPAIEANTKGDKIGMRHATYNMIRTVLLLDGFSPLSWNVSETISSDVLDALENNPEPKYLTKAAAMSIEGRNEIATLTADSIRRRYYQGQI